MRRGALVVLAGLLLGLAASARAGDSQSRIGFDGPLETDGLPAGWRAIEFSGGWFSKAKTPVRYSVAQAESRTIVHALANAAASFLIRRAPADLSLKTTPILRWSWRVDRATKNGDGRSKATDDFAARVWVGFETNWDDDEWEWSDRRKASKARDDYGFEPPGYWIHYVWAQNRQHEEAFDEPYAPKMFKCVCVRSREDALGKWYIEERDPAKDFERCFHKKAPRVTAIAIMTDSDDMGGVSEASYADIAFVGSQAP